MNNTKDLSVQPWYRQPWPWLLMLGPAVVVVAGIATAWIAYSTSDGLVAEDYYKKGLVVDQVLARSREAKDLGLRFRARFTAEAIDAALSATKPDNFAYPRRLMVTLSHPTRAGLDQQFVLERADDRDGRDGHYAGKFRLPASGHWLVLIEDDAASWRLLGNIILPANGELALGND